MEKLLKKFFLCGKNLFDLTQKSLGKDSLNFEGRCFSMSPLIFSKRKEKYWGIENVT